MVWPPRSWLRDLTGLDHDTPDAVVADGEGWVRARATGRRMHAGWLHLPSLGDLRRVTAGAGAPGAPPLPLRQIIGDTVTLHGDPAHAGAVFQVASQANLLEMPGPEVTPDAGLADYWHDRTQGPGSVMACGAGLLWRAYLVPLGEGRGQTAVRQIDTLADLGAALGNDGWRWWRMQNGYALGTDVGALSARIAGMDEAARDGLRALLRVGVQADTEVTLAPGGHRVTQVLACALPVAYDRAPAADWETFARLVLEAAYEATLRAALAHAGPARPVRVFLTRLGGGVFGNDPRWIDAAIDRALAVLAGAPLDVAMVRFG